jgi:hypothetical protein
MSRLRSPKSFLVNCVPRDVSAMKFSSSEDKEISIIGAFPKEPPCSNTGEQGRREEISDGDLGGDGDPAVESWHRWAKDFTLGRESAHT